MTIIKKLIKYVIATQKKLCYSLNKNRIEGKRTDRMKSNDLSIFDIANFFLKIVERDAGSTITPLKLQKILYYAQGWHLALFDTELFGNDFEAWAHGPANVDIYTKYKTYGFSAIEAPKGDLPIIPEKLTDFLYSIWNTYGIYDGKYLEKLTHSETPWIIARGDCKEGTSCTNKISKESMKVFFKNKLNESKS